MPETRQIMVRAQPQTYEYIKAEAARRNLSISRTAAAMLDRATALGWEVTTVGAVDPGKAGNHETGNGWPV